jgi:hypothetical protein
MTRFRWLFCALLLMVLFGSEAQAGTVTAASCNESDVSKALNSATSGGTIVIIPAGTCTWTTGLVYQQVGDLIIQGSGSQTTLGGGDATVIVDALPKGVGQDEPLIINTVAGKQFRLTAITFQGGPSSQGTGFHGSLQVSGFSQSVRVDHVHFLNLNDTNVTFAGWEYGVLDHCLFDFKSINNGVRVEHANWNNGVNGDASWADSAYFGTVKAIYIESNVFNCSAAGGCYANDADNGSHFVFRFNTLNTTHFQVHDQSTDFRAPRMFEFYNNTLTWTSATAGGAALFLRDGTGLFFNNTLVGYGGGVSLWTDRNQNQLSWGSTPNNWGYCGNQFGPSNWDGNTDSTGYPCIDQIGRGKGDLLRGNFPNKVNSTTGNISWPHQAIEPMYEWQDSYTGPGYATSFWGSTTSNIVANRDYYLWCNPASPAGCSNFDGSVGTGTGLLAARPSACTAGPGGNTNGVAYWATDTNTLYVCNPTNTWTAYYTPFTYPHPLTLGTDPPPVAPTNISVVIH